jgi:hypothetical protein
MSNDEENTKSGPPHIWAVCVGVAALVSLVGAKYYHKTYPQFLEQLLGSLGIALLCLGTGCYLLYMAVIGVRSGAIEGNYVPVKFKRSDSTFRFWFVVVFDLLGGVFLLLGGIGHFFGLW